MYLPILTLNNCSKVIIMINFNDNSILLKMIKLLVLCDLWGGEVRFTYCLSVLYFPCNNRDIKQFWFFLLSKLFNFSSQLFLVAIYTQIAKYFSNRFILYLVVGNSCDRNFCVALLRELIEIHRRLQW